MASPVAELEAGLQAMQGLKPPGVSGSRISALTALCVNNVQSESVLVQKLYTHFKKTPGTHKLGVLYVVDSVTRKWLDQAKQNGQTVDGSAPDGSYAAGVNRVTELIPVLMNDILSTAPADQKDKIKKLVDIWEKGQTFPAALIQSFREKLNAPPPNTSTTPPGSPPVNAPNANANANTNGNGNGSRFGAPPAAPSALPPNIMETLANLAKQNAGAAASATPPTMAAPFGQPPQSYAAQPHVSAPYGAPAPYQMAPAQQPPFSMPYGQGSSAQVAAPPAPAPAPANNSQLPPALAGLAGLISAASQQQQQQQQQPALVQPVQQAPPPQQGAPNLQQNLILIQALLAQGLPIESITGILGSLGGAQGGAPGAGGAGSLVPSALAAAAAGGGNGNGQGGQWPPNGNGQSNGWGNGNADRGYGNRGRTRSRSPQYWEGNGDRNGRRGSPSGRGGGGDRARGRDYRQRSPVGGHHNGGGSDSPRQPPGPGEKWIEHDPSLPSGTIRVLSRTLFVGGVTIPESDLRSIFLRFGDVQTCIVNKEKRHAFVKMYTRKDAEAAKEGMEQLRHDDSGLRTRWGVGFGPRDCSDYAKGISVIPIAKLTDADRKWLLTAPWGGSGGQAITPGLVVEEPDIEIGAGVSSKAISRRMQTDRGGINGPRSTRREEEIANANAIPINPNGPGAGRRGGRGNHSGGGRGGYDRRGGDDGGYDNGGGNSNHSAPAAVLPFQFGAAANNLFPQGGYNYQAE